MDWTEGPCIFVCLLSCICMTVAVDEGVQTEDVQAEFGESATLKCLLMKYNEVVQVTWKKIQKGNETKLATYTRENGARVDKLYENLLNISTLGLNKTAITIYKMSLEDEGCYACVFNVFPEGAKQGRVRLSISGEVLIEKSHKVRLGDDITLKCYVRKPDNVSQFSWEKDGQTIGIYRPGIVKIDAQFQMLVDLSKTYGVSALTILKAAVGDKGEYKCVFNIFPTGSAHGTTQLHVHSFANNLHPEILAVTLPLISFLVRL